jgi:protein O-mannosyl-transferase
LSPPLTSQNKLIILSLLLLLATLAVYNPISHAPFLNYDDDYYIVQNSHIRAGLNWSAVTWAFQSTELSNWHPLTWMSHAFDVQFFGMNPSGHHYMNVLFHAGNAVLLFLFLRRSTGVIWQSFFVAIIFAIHPVNVESVAWISERKNVLSMMFFLIGLIAYTSYARKPSLKRYFPVVVSFALASMAKPQVITFPFVLILLDYWPLDRLFGPPPSQGRNPAASQHRALSRLVLEKLPLFALSAASALITMKVQTTAIHLDLPLKVRVANAALSYVKYIKMMVWPHHLAPLYPHPGALVDASLAVGAVLVLIAITALTVVYRDHRYLLVGWLWFLGTLVPMAGLVQVGVQSMADRYAYIPYIGLLIMLSWGLGEAITSFRIPRSVAAVGASAAVLALGAVSWMQIHYWCDNEALWAHTLAVTRDNYIAEDSMALALAAKGNTSAAVPHFQRALQIHPTDPIGNLNLGVYEHGRGNYALAITRYKNVLELTDNRRLLTSAFANLGYAYLALKQYDQAKQNFDAALQEFRENAQAFLGLGLLAQKGGDFQSAAYDYSRSVQFQRTDVGFLLLSQALEMRGEAKAAESARLQAERISRDLESAKKQMQQLLRQ